MEFNEQNVQSWLDANPRFAHSDRNFEILSEYLRLAAKANRQVDTIEKLNSLVSLNRNHFEWLRSDAEINAAVSAAVAAIPKPDQPKPERLKGLTPAERLYSVGVEATRHISHTTREENDLKQSSVLAQMAQAAAKTRADIERQEKIAEARSIVVYSPGPNGRINHAATESARKAALAKLGISK